MLLLMWIVTSILDGYHCFGGNECLSLHDDCDSRFLQKFIFLFIRLYHVGSKKAVISMWHVLSFKLRYSSLYIRETDAGSRVIPIRTKHYHAVCYTKPLNVIYYSSKSVAHNYWLREFESRHNLQTTERARTWFDNKNRNLWNRTLTKDLVY